LFLVHKGDRETLWRAMEDNAREFPDKQYEVHRALQDGNLVAVHGKVTLSPEKVYSVIHVFRFEDDKIIESWEASQEELKDSPNENGLF
jgi:predicted SnoaL-like aldol condensation-catalyzing enzyme